MSKPSISCEQDQAPVDTSDIPELDDDFFRRGLVGSHRDELSDDLHELFWAHPDNAAAMHRLGYAR